MPSRFHPRVAVEIPAVPLCAHRDCGARLGRRSLSLLSRSCGCIGETCDGQTVVHSRVRALLEHHTAHAATGNPSSSRRAPPARDTPREFLKCWERERLTCSEWFLQRKVETVPREEGEQAWEEGESKTVRHRPARCPSVFACEWMGRGLAATEGPGPRQADTPQQEWSPAECLGLTAIWSKF